MLQTTASLSLPKASHHSPLQPWLVDGFWESLLILAPPFLSTLLALTLTLNQQASTTARSMPLWFWVVCIVMVDVAHVYSTLFQTYFQTEERHRHPLRYSLIPLFSFLGGCFVHSLSASLFWTLLAYLAVFHFVRQQYGLMALYKRKEVQDDSVFARFGNSLDTVLIYATMLYPLIYWHTHLPREFSWFMPGDFLTAVPFWLEPFAGGVYGLVILVYCFKEWQGFKNSGWINLPKNLILLGTACAWYTGIVLLNGDMAFTLTNVLSHGIPYMGLIWLLQNKQTIQNKGQNSSQNKAKNTLKAKSALTELPTLLPGLFLGLLLLWALAFTEEAFWDGFVWQEHQSVFRWLPFFDVLPSFSPLDMNALSWVVPLLATPQITHYLLDGFIWRKSEASQL